MRNAAQTGAHPNTISRRELLGQMAGFSLGLPFSRAGLFPLLQASAPRQQQHAAPPRPAIPPLPSTLSPEDDQFLNDLEKWADAATAAILSAEAQSMIGALGL